MYSIAPVRIRFDRSPPEFSGTSAFVTNVTDFDVVNLKPIDPLTMSSRTSGIVVGAYTLGEPLQQLA